MKSATAWISDFLIDPETGKPFELLPAEIAFLEQAFDLDQNGRLRYPELVYSAPKKSGKTGFAAMVALYFAFNCGAKCAEVIIAANDLDQASTRVLAAIKQIVEASPILRPIATIYRHSVEFSEPKATITAIPADAAGAAGSNANLVIFDELHGFTSERAQRFWDECTPPPTRKIAARLTVSYAGFVGESELLENLYHRGLEQPLIGQDMHAGDGMLMFWSHRPVAPWQDERWLAQMKATMRPLAYQRMIENRFVSSESAFISADSWDACVAPDMSPWRPSGSDNYTPVFIGIDVATKFDGTCISVVTRNAENGVIKVLASITFYPTGGQPLDIGGIIPHQLKLLKQRWPRMMEIRYDPFQMAAIAARLDRDGFPVKEFPQTQANLSAATSCLYGLIQSKSLLVPQNKELRAAAIHAAAVDTGRGWKITKGSTGSFVDQIVALSMACLAATTAADLAEQPPMQFQPPIITSKDRDTGAITVYGAPHDPHGPPSHYLKQNQTAEPWRPYVDSYGVRSDKLF